jgi:cyclic beta-1,2-glucan synthetase
MAFSDSFFVQLVQRLREQDPEAIPAVGWLERRLEQAGTTSDELVRREHQLRGATNVTVRNIITSMGLISDVDWATLFESVSLVDEELRSSGVFADMDFSTRNLYRNADDQLGRGTARRRRPAPPRAAPAKRRGTESGARTPATIWSATGAAPSNGRSATARAG